MKVDLYTTSSDAVRWLEKHGGIASFRSSDANSTTVSVGAMTCTAGTLLQAVNAIRVKIAEYLE